MMRSLEGPLRGLQGNWAYFSSALEADLRQAFQLKLDSTMPNLHIGLRVLGGRIYSVRVRVGGVAKATRGPLWAGVARDAGESFQGQS